MFRLFKKSEESNATWYRHWTSAGVVLARPADSAEGEIIDNPLMDGYITQLSDDGLSTETELGHVLTWDAIYEALGNPVYADLRLLLNIPEFTEARPALCSSHSLTDRDFSIVIAGWHSDDGRKLFTTTNGPLMVNGERHEFMRPQQWQLFKEVIAFARRADTERDELTHRQAWGRIRKIALTSNAVLDDFLVRSVVLTPEKLHIGLRRSESIAEDRVTEIEPSFQGAPEGWLETFDRAREVRDRYDISTPDGIIQVLVTPKVKTVLQEIKRLEGRRVAGSRAQAFLLNPYAALGADAVDVIEEAQFEKARDEAGLSYERFSPVFERDATGYPLKTGLLIEAARSTGPTSSEMQWLSDTELSRFIKVLDRSLALGNQLVAWNGYDLALQGDSEQHLQDLKAALERRQTPPTLVSYAQVYDLSAYSARVESVGIERTYYSPYIAKKKEGDGWFPENVLPVVLYQPQDGGEPVAIPTSKNAVEKLAKELQAALAEGKTTITAPWLPAPITVDEARRISSTFASAFSDIESGRPFDPPKRQPARDTLGQKKQLVLRANIQSLEYEELRREAMQAVPTAAKLPASIRPERSLLPHQREGLAWMQHLYNLQAEYQVRGAVLADDMGLGKTFQLLAFMAYLLERDPEVSPMLVVAPVSLLENWAEEAHKFFMPGALPLLTAYGAGLQSLRVPRAQIDKRLQTEDGLVKFLKPTWVGSAKIVLTTYETLRDLEFSFAAQKWSLMVCDEAQRIKNPAAMVTRAAKKQNVAFKIACTGTPVENTLADMWCLFDYVQPGLLGALNDFGQRYRKPIEAKTDEERARVEELRTRIAPQILRRLKTDVAKELPPKIIVEQCRRLPLSSIQRNLIAKAVDSFKRRGDTKSASPFKNHLGLLHYLRLVCTDPRQHGLNIFRPEPPAQYRAKAPKLDWLLAQLDAIKTKGEKVIVFCEFREIQRLLQHYIETAHGFRPDIINGDAPASADHIASRQKRIRAFGDSPGFGVIILSPIAVGFGVNIQAANHVVHYTRTWNPAKEDQATDRAYRIGQTKPVYVYYPVVHADDFTTFDVKLDQLLTHKRSLAEDMLNGSGDVRPGDFDVVNILPATDAGDIDERITLDMALRMNGQHFECLIAALWNKQGYETHLTRNSKDNGIDIVALDGAKGHLIQAKASSTDGSKLSWDAVKEVVAGAAFYERLYAGVKFDRICVTNQFFSPQAHDNAQLNGVVLLEQKHLGKSLQEIAVTVIDVERMLYRDRLTVGIPTD